MICDVLGCGSIHPLSQVRDRHRHPESLGDIEHLADIRGDGAQQLQRRPSAALEREPHHVCHAGQQLDPHSGPPYNSPTPYYIRGAQAM